MNDNVYGRPVVLFLGAGASVSLGKKTTFEFLEWLKSAQPGINYGHLISVCHQIEASKEVGKKYDVEVILDYLQELIRAGELFEKCGDAEILRRLEKESYQRTSSTQPHSFGAVSCLEENMQLRDRIQDLVVEHYSEIDEEQVVELYSPLLVKLAEFYPLTVFTTNYDIAIEKLHESGVIELIDGFSDGKYLKSRWSREGYDFYHPPSKGDLILFKLHGSVDWVETPLEGIQRVDIPKRELGGAQRVIAYPSQLKREIHQEPYRTNYDYLIACLLHAKVCAVIGFSFRDQEIFEEFRQAMDLNEELKLVFVDPDAEAVKKHLESKVGFESFFLDSTLKPEHITICERFTSQTAASIGDRIASTVRQ